MAFWVELEEMLGPVFGPIVRGIFEPVWRVFEDPSFRTTILSTIIWTVLIVGGLVFVIYEAPGFFSLMMGTQSTSQRTVSTSSSTQTRLAQSAQRQASKHSAAREAATTKLEEDREKRQAEVRAYGVKVSSRINRTGEEFILSVDVNNESSNQIDMVVVDIDLPADINIAIGSFRMQRLGTIAAGQTKVAEFGIQPRGGNMEEISGHVEFLGATYEVSKLAIPPPEVIA
ncbi:MAG: hypothetical protein ACW98U_04175 [Candidatus Thorarchaeota archaeon]|jgi:hypothetical protein